MIAKKTIPVPTKVPEKKAFRAEDWVTMTLPLQEVKDIKLAFDVFDSDGSGEIDPSELKTAFQSLGFSKDNKFVYQILAELDDDQTGTIGFQEFVKLATAKIGEKDNRQTFNKVFQSFDLNNEGRFRVEELKRVAHELGEDFTAEEIEEAFTRADLDNDGFVTSEDFYNIMTHRVYWRT